VLEDGPALPSVEGEPRGAWIDAIVSKVEASLERVPVSIEENVGESVSGLPRRLHRAGVVAIREHAAHAPEQSVEPTSHPNLEASHRAAERGPIGGLDDQVQMVALSRRMNEAHI
jgi:hypothetical protein